MARVQQADTMGNVQFDPGIAQSVLTNKDRQSKEKIAMEQIGAQRDIAAGEQQASMSNANTQASASMANTRMGVQGEMGMQTQRLAAQRGAQESQQAFEKWAKMQDQQLTEGLAADRANLELALQDHSQEYQHSEGELRYKRGLEMMESEQKWATKTAVMGANVIINLMDYMAQNGVPAADAAQQVDEMSRMADNHAKDIKVIEDVFSSAAEDGGRIMKSAISGGLTNADMVGAKNEPGRLATLRAESILGYALKESGLENGGWSTKDWTGGPSAISSKILAKRADKSKPFEVIELARLVKASHSILSATATTKDPSLLKLRDLAMDVEAGIQQAGRDPDTLTKNFVQTARQMSQGIEPERLVIEPLKQGKQLLDIKGMLSGMLADQGLSFKKGTPIGDMNARMEENFNQQWSQLASRGTGQQGYNTTLPTDKLGYTEQMGPPQELQRGNERERTALTSGLQGRYGGR